MFLVCLSFCNHPPSSHPCLYEFSRVAQHRNHQWCSLNSRQFYSLGFPVLYSRILSQLPLSSCLSYVCTQVYVQTSSKWSSYIALGLTSKISFKLYHFLKDYFQTQLPLAKFGVITSVCALWSTQIQPTTWFCSNPVCNEGMVGHNSNPQKKTSGTVKEIK